MYIEYSNEEIEEFFIAERAPKTKILAPHRQVAPQPNAPQSSTQPVQPKPVVKKLDTKGIDIKHLAQTCSVKRFPIGSKLFKPGEEVTQMHIVVQGKVSIILNGEVVKSLGVGDLVGETALLSGTPCSESAEFATDGIALLVKKNDIQSAISIDPALGYKLLETLGAYIQKLLGEIEILKNANK
ncbi:MAG: Cyclic nucleotide-binding domain [Pseudomonadota bacterium]|jgi:hypothetical protein